MFVENLKKKLDYIFFQRSIPVQVSRSGFALIPYSDFGDAIGTAAVKQTWDFISTIDEMAGEFNAQFSGIAFGQVILRKLAAPAAECNLPTHAMKCRLFEPVASASADGTGESSCGNMRSGYNPDTLMPVPGTPAYEEMLRVKELRGVECLIVDAMKLSEADVETLRQRLNKHTGDLILYKYPELSVQPVECCSETNALMPDGSEVVFNLTRSNDGHWSVAGQTTGMAWCGKDPLYALAAFLGRDDVCKFMTGSITKEPEDIQEEKPAKNYLDSDELIADGSCISEYEIIGNNSFKRLLSFPKSTILIYNGNSWGARDILVVHGAGNTPRYFTRVYPEVQEGDKAFVLTKSGEYCIAFMQDGYLMKNQVNKSVPLDCPMVLGVEIDTGNV